MAGWGSTLVYDGPMSPVLMDVAVRIAANDRCGSYRTKNREAVCYFARNRRRFGGICSGDSGGQCCGLLSFVAAKIVEVDRCNQDDVSQSPVFRNFVIMIDDDLTS